MSPAKIFILRFVTWIGLVILVGKYVDNGLVALVIFLLGLVYGLTCYSDGKRDGKIELTRFFRNWLERNYSIDLFDEINKEAEKL